MGFFTTPSSAESLGQHMAAVQWSGSSPLDEAGVKLCYAQIQGLCKLGFNGKTDWELTVSCGLHFLEAVQVVLSNSQKHCCATYSVLVRKSKHSTTVASLKKVNSTPARPIQAICLQNRFQFSCPCQRSVFIYWKICLRGTYKRETNL